MKTEALIGVAALLAVGAVAYFLTRPDRVVQTPMGPMTKSEANARGFDWSVRWLSDLRRSDAKTQAGYDASIVYRNTGLQATGGQDSPGTLSAIEGLDLRL